jgi:hypothetical protein
MNNQEHSAALKKIKMELIDIAYRTDPQSVLDFFALAALHVDIDTVDYIIAKYGDRFPNRLDEMNEVRDALVAVLAEFPEEDDLETQAQAATDALLAKYML